MKNTPITARVKSGMFKTKEPLLNVGPAGVDGNNKTRTMPSPSKMKGYSMKSSPFKQESQAKKNVDEAVSSEASLIFDGKGGAGGVRETTTILPGEKGTPDVITEPTETFTGEKATGEKAKEWAKQNEYCKGKPKARLVVLVFINMKAELLKKENLELQTKLLKQKLKGILFANQKAMLNQLTIDVRT